MPEQLPNLVAHPTEIDGLFLLDPRKMDDSRGFFAESFKYDQVEEALGFPLDIKQVNHSRSQRGVLRGIHADPWHKMIYIPRGEVFCAWVDLREGDGFGKVVTATIKEGHGAFVPKGCGNSYQVLSEEADYMYFVTDLWRPGLVYPAVSYDDPELGIQWPIADAIISDKDQHNPTLAEYREKIS